MPKIGDKVVWSAPEEHYLYVGILICFDSADKGWLVQVDKDIAEHADAEFKRNYLFDIDGYYCTEYGIDSVHISVPAIWAWVKGERPDNTECIIHRLLNDKVKLPVVELIPINDYVCPHCNNNRCSKSERTCWRCGNLL